MTLGVIAIEKSGIALNVPDDQLDSYIEKILKKFSYNPVELNNLIITSIHEIYGLEDQQAIQKIIYSVRRISKCKILVVLNKWYQGIFKPDGADDLIYVNSLVYWVYYRTMQLKESVPAKEYKKSNRWLFLIGKPDKTQRIGILYQLYKRNLYPYGDWSLYIHNDYIKANCKNYLPPMSEEEYETFIANSVRTLDNPPINFYPDGSHYTGIPFDTDMYDRAGFQVIGESDMNYAIHTFTEKTYLAIINKRPFIVLTSMGALNKLKDLGFKTFTEYLLIKDYNDQYECNDVTPVVDNIEHWVNNIEKDYEQIKLDVEHNYKRFIDLARQEGKLVKDLIDKYNLKCSIADIIQGY